MRILIFIIICFLSLHVYAVPAYPGRIEVIVKNGKTVSIFMKGDENFKYALSEDGFTLLSDGSDWWYAEKDERGNLVTSKFQLAALEDADEDLKTFKASCPKHLMKDAHIVNNVQRNQVRRIGIHNGEPIVGQRRALVVLMQYKDVKMSKTHEEFEALFVYRVKKAVGGGKIAHSRAAYHIGKGNFKHRSDYFRYYHCGKQN